MTKSPKRLGSLFVKLVAAAIIVIGSMLVRRWKKIPLASKRLKILDVPIDPVTMPVALDRIHEFIQSGKPHHIFTADASGIMQAQQDPALCDIIKQADLVTADGAGVMIASRLRGAALPERVSGVDLVQKVSGLAAANGYSVYLFGAAEGVAQAAADTLQSRFPGLRIAGTRNGYFTEAEEEQIVRQIADAQPDALFVALGIPKQEIFIRKHFTELGVPVMIGIGGSFDVISGKLQRAPCWMQRAGLEWLYRFAQEPSRLPRLAALPNFILAAWRSRSRAL